MPYAHDVSILGPGRDFKVLGDSLFLNYQAVVPTRLEWAAVTGILS